MTILYISACWWCIYTGSLKKRYSSNLNHIPTIQKKYHNAVPNYHWNLGAEIPVQSPKHNHCHSFIRQWVIPQKKWGWDIQHTYISFGGYIRWYIPGMPSLWLVKSPICDAWPSHFPLPVIPITVLLYPHWLIIKSPVHWYWCLPNPYASISPSLGNVFFHDIPLKSPKIFLFLVKTLHFPISSKDLHQPGATERPPVPLPPLRTRFQLRRHHGSTCAQGRRAQGHGRRQRQRRREGGWLCDHLPISPAIQGRVTWWKCDGSSRWVQFR